MEHVREWSGDESAVVCSVNHRHADRPQPQVSIGQDLLHTLLATYVS